MIKPTYRPFVMMVLIVMLIHFIPSCSQGRYLSNLTELTPPNFERHFGSPDIVDSKLYDCRKESSLKRCGEIADRGVDVLVYGWKMQKLSTGGHLWIKYEIELLNELVIRDGHEVWRYVGNDTIPKDGYIVIVEY